MKSVFVLFFIILFNSQSEDFKASIQNGEPPIFTDILILNTRKECEETVTTLAKQVVKFDDVLMAAECIEVTYPTGKPI
jgi:hypothetical protein